MKSNMMWTLLLGAFFSCVQEEELSGPLPVGSWVQGEHVDQGFTLQQVSNIPANTYGYRFLPNGKMVNRTLSGWCATPPIVTQDYEGTWQLDGDILTWETPFWGGTEIQEWKISPIAQNQIQVEVIRRDYMYAF